MPDGYVIHLPKPKRRSPHIFGDAVSVPAHKTLTRHQQTERTCLICGAVKVTVHGENFAWREWRKRGEAGQGIDDLVCEPTLGAQS